MSFYPQNNYFLIHPAYDVHRRRRPPPPSDSRGGKRKAQLVLSPSLVGDRAIYINVQRAHLSSPSGSAVRVGVCNLEVQGSIPGGGVRKIPVQVERQTLI